MKSLVLLLMFFIVACNNSGSQTINVEKTTNHSEKIVSITDDQFIMDAIENKLDINNIESICRDYNKEIKIVRNAYNNKLDTVTVYFDNNDTVVMYESVDKKFILKMNINTSKIGLLRDTVKIGLDNKYFIEKYPTIKNIDIFEICNTEGYICFLFKVRPFRYLPI